MDSSSEGGLDSSRVNDTGRTYDRISKIGRNGRREQVSCAQSEGGSGWLAGRRWAELRSNSRSRDTRMEQRRVVSLAGN